jgi:hypothetical protein
MTVDQHPLSRALLHTLKHSSKDVYGVLLGPSIDSPELITRCVPLFHSRCVTVPLVRTAFSLLDRVLIKGADIVGVYFAAIAGSESEISPVSKWICSQILKTTGKASITCWKYRAPKPEDSNEWPFDAFVVRADESVVRNAEIRPKSGLYAQEDVQEGVKLLQASRNSDDADSYFGWDFEDHLQDPSREWIRTE